MRSRITIVSAAAGWGKSTAVRSALADAPHHWFDGSKPGMRDALLALGDPNDRLVVLDGVDLLDEESMRALLGLTKRFASSRWVLVARSAERLPVTNWIGSGDASAPVSHEDLALSLLEVRSAAEALGVRADDAAIQFVHAFSGGWPIAVRFALVALQQSSDLARAEAMARRLLNAYVESEMLANLTSEQRELLSQAALLGPVDESLFAAIGCEDGAAALKLLRSAPVPWFESGEWIALHPAFTQAAIAGIPAAERRSRATGAAAALRSRRYAARAFEVVRQYAPDEIVNELHAHNFELLDAGLWQEVDGAIRGLPQSLRRDDPIVVALRAEIEAQAGAPQRAGDLYRRAVRLAQDTAAVSCVRRRYALHLLNQGDTETLAAIEPALTLGTDVDRVDALGILASALAIAGRVDEARDAALRALDLATELDDEGLLARCSQRMSYVEYQSGNIAEAERYAHEAARLSHRIGAWFHFICAHSVLRAIALGARDDRAAGLWHAQQMGIGAQHTRDRRHQLYALSVQYVLEVERGRTDRALAIESELPAHSSGWRDELECALAFAVRRSWNAEFSVAIRQLEKLKDRLSDPAESRLLCGALAMYAAFSGDDAAAWEHLRSCRKAPGTNARASVMSNALADCCAAMAQVFLGHPASAIRRLARVPGATSGHRAVAAFIRELAALGATLGPKTAAGAIERLRAAGQEGFAQAVTAALATRTRGDAVPLTTAELQVLAGMARGRTAKNIAEDHCRSVHTIRNHIKAIIRKLGASGTIEAVAIAKRSGLAT